MRSGKGKLFLNVEEITKKFINFYYEMFMQEE